ncbi:MAG: OsmC family protein [Kofleriaceae bacterium]|nr:OsmC family protein [Kofleriaceae bacterium]MCL4226467.1 OsmC family protein [Myxococcales bacterium]
MSTHEARLVWTRATPDFDLKTYPRDHAITFPSGVTVTGSAAAAPSTPAGTVGPDTIDPEAMTVAAVSSCHMMFFLALAAKRGLVIDRYEDAPIGLLEPRDGATWLTKITLRPRVTWGGDAPGADVVADLHRSAHKRCYIASSLRGEVAVEPAD